MSLHVDIHPADMGGCGHYRMIWPGTALSMAGGPKVTVITPDREVPYALKMMLVDKPDGSTVVVGMHEVPECDVIVLQRPLNRLLVDAIPFLQASGVAVVVELDDDFQAVNRLNVAWKGIQPRTDPEHNWQHLMRACSMADMVTVSTPALARKYAKHGRVRVIPNYLPSLWTGIEHVTEDGKCVIGWSGSVDTHPTDLKQVGPVIARVARENEGVDVAVIGTGKGVAAAFGLEQVRASGWQPIHDYPRAVSMLDVGLVPLDMTPFNEAKSWLKGLEYAACGTPFVASPTGEYRRLADAGIGLLAKNGEQWYKHLTRLARSEDYRATLGHRWQSIARTSFSLLDHLDRWDEAWSAAREHLVTRSLALAGVR